MQITYYTISAVNASGQALAVSSLMRELLGAGHDGTQKSEMLVCPVQNNHYCISHKSQSTNIPWTEDPSFRSGLDFCHTSTPTSQHGCPVPRFAAQTCKHYCQQSAVLSTSFVLAMAGIIGALPSALAFLCGCKKGYILFLFISFICLFFTVSKW